MTIQEILEAHKLMDVSHLILTHEYCNCNELFENKTTHRAHLAEVLEKHMPEREAQLRQLVRDMTDPGACWFDHHGGCQEHGYLDLKPGEQCPHAEAKQLLGDEPNGR